MDNKTYYAVVSALFAIVGLAHVTRAFFGWEMTVDGVIIPIWVSWVAGLSVLYLAYRGYTSKKIHGKKK